LLGAQHVARAQGHLGAVAESHCQRIGERTGGEMCLDLARSDEARCTQVAAARHSPLLPPRFSSRRTPSITMPRSTALHMS